MRKTIRPRFVFGFLLTWLLLPVLAQAASITPLGANVVADDDTLIFRYRSNPGIWQRSTAQQTAVQESKTYDGQIYFTIEDDANHYRVISSDNGLSYQTRFAGSQPIKLAEQPGALIAVAVDKLAVFLASGAMSEYLLPGHTYAEPAKFTALLGGDVGFFVIGSGRVDVFALNQSNSSPKWSFTCADAEVFQEPKVFLQCDERVYVFNQTDFDEILTGVTYVSGSSLMRLWQGTASQFFLVGQSVTELAFSDFQPGDQLEVVGERLFYRKTTGLFEVGWRLDPVEVVAVAGGGVLRLSDGGQKVILQDAGVLAYSKSFNFWANTNLIGEYELLATADSLIAYLPDDSEAFYEDQPGMFQEMESSWAASSKIKVVRSTDHGLFLLLRNSSNNPNLYRSADNRSWQRITLPSTPTQLVTISQARQLPEGTPVEVSGGVTVLPGFAGDEIVYLADGTGGIQLYLSQSKGIYALDGYRTAVAIGKMSGSKVGRILLDAANTFIAGPPLLPIDEELPIASASQRLAQTARIRGTLSDIATDTAVISDGTGSIKLHFDGIKEKFKNGDTVLLRTVIDLNTATDVVESWFAGETAQLVSSGVLAVEKEKAVATTSKTPAITSAKSVTESPAKSATPVARRTTLLAEEDTKVAGIADPAPLPNSLVFLAGLMAGVLIIRGRRFQKYFS